MKSTRNMVVLQVVITGLVTALGVVALADGRFLVGVLLVALAGARVAMIVERRRRRVDFARRFPGMASRGRG